MGNVGKNLAKNVNRLRKAKGWTQAMLAEFIELSQNAITAIENQKAWPTLLTIQKLAKVFEIEEEELFLGKTWLEKNPTNEEVLAYLAEQLGMNKKNDNEPTDQNIGSKKNTRKIMTESLRKTPKSNSSDLESL